MNTSFTQKAVLGLCFLAAPVAMLIAQQDVMPPVRRGQMADHLAQSLGLTEDQKAQVQTIQKETRRQEMELRKAESEKIRALLTDEQKAKYDQMHARMEGRGPGGGEQPGPPPQDPQ